MHLQIAGLECLIAIYSLVFSAWACAMALRRKCVVHSEASQIHPSGSACGLVRPNRMSSGVAMDRTKDVLKSVASVGSDQCPEMPRMCTMTR